MGADGQLNSPSNASGNPEGVTSLTPQRWQQIKEVFCLALERELDQRDSFLLEACRGEMTLRREVESLLASASNDSSATSNLLQIVSPEQPISPAEENDPMLGRRIGEYRVERRIGYGGMAAVYLASRADEQFSMQVAIKLLRPDLDHADLLRRFLNERQTLAALNHPNIVKLIDGGSTEERLPYLVMDYVEGTPIDEYCDTHSLSIQQRLRLFQKICDAVAYAHQHRVIHRDLKPNNILVTADGTPKLLDFGISKVLAPGDESEMTKTMSRRLTPAYASPEQVRGEPVTSATDVYSLGVVLYGLLTGHRPYKLKQRTPAAVERAICDQEPESPSSAVDRIETETRPDGKTMTITAEFVSRTREGQPDKLRRSLRGDLDNIVLKALQKEPKRRYASVSQFAQDIQLNLDDRPVEARPRTWTYRAAKFALRRKTEVVAVIVMLSVLVGAAGLITREEWRATSRAREALSNQQLRNRRSVAVLGFKNLSGRTDKAWLSTALSEMLTSELAAGGMLRTIVASNIVQAKDDLSLSETNSLTSETLTNLYRRLGSDYVVTGSFLDSGESDGRLRLEVRLQDAVKGETMVLVSLNGTEMRMPELVWRAGSDLRTKLGLSTLSASDHASVQASLPSNPEAGKYYAEGLAKLRVFDALAARDLLERAVRSDPDFALAHSALADNWAALGYDQKAKEEAKRAFDLSAGLSREDRLLIEARYCEMNQEWRRASQIYSALFEFFPDNIEYGLKLVAAQIGAGNTKEAMNSIDALHNLPEPMRDDPRIDFLEDDLVFFDPVRGDAALDRAMRKVTSLGSTGLMAQVKWREGATFLRAGDLARSMASSEAAGRLFAKLGNQDGVAQTEMAKADLYLRQGDRNSAKKMFDEALASYKTSGNERGAAAALSNLGALRGYEGDWREADKTHRAAIAIFRKIQSKRGVADALNNFAFTQMSEGNLAAARSMFEESMAIFREMDDQGGIAMQTGHIARILLLKGDLAGAEKNCVEALRVLHNVQDPHFIPGVLSTLGAIRMSQGRLREAQNNFETAESTRGKIGEIEDASLSQLDLARLALEEGRYHEAKVSARKAAAGFRKIDSRYFESYALVLVAESAAAEGKMDEARELIDRAVPWSQQSVDFDVGVPRAIAIARVHSRLAAFSHKNAFDEDIEILEKVLAEATERGYLPYQFEARLELGKTEIKAERSSAGLTRLADLERDAGTCGFELIARKARAARREMAVN